MTAVTNSQLGNEKLTKKRGLACCKRVTSHESRITIFTIHDCDGQVGKVQGHMLPELEFHRSVAKRASPIRHGKLRMPLAVSSHLCASFCKWWLLIYPAQRLLPRRQGWHTLTTGTVTSILCEHAPVSSSLEFSGLYSVCIYGQRHPGNISNLVLMVLHKPCSLLPAQSSQRWSQLLWYHRPSLKLFPVHRKWTPFRDSIRKRGCRHVKLLELQSRHTDTISPIEHGTGQWFVVAGKAGIQLIPAPLG